MKVNMMTEFEREYIDLCLRYAKVLHIGKRDAFHITGCWAYRCGNRLTARRNIYTGSPKGVK